MLQRVRQRDRKAPRFRWTKGRHIVMTEDLFKKYQTSVENPLEEYSLFKSVVEDFNVLLKEKAISNRDGVKLPAYMGILAICSYKARKRMPINWLNTVENGVKLKEYNLHTGGLACKIVYSVYTAKYKFRNWALWRFEGNRDFKAKVSDAFIENYRYYKRLDNKSHVSKMFREVYETKYRSNDNIGTNIVDQGNEQADQCGQQDLGSIHI